MLPLTLIFFCPCLASKETAFVYALTSAAVVHSVTKSCTAGVLPDCACTKPDYIKYYGKRVKARCDENIDYGLLFSQLFVDAPDNDKQAKVKFRRSGQNLVNLHNSRAGRKVPFYFEHITLFKALEL
jgi:hypothetical protein